MSQHPRPEFTYLGHATILCELPSGETVLIDPWRSHRKRILAAKSAILPASWSIRYRPLMSNNVPEHPAEMIPEHIHKHILPLLLLCKHIPRKYIS